MGAISKGFLIVAFVAMFLDQAIAARTRRSRYYSSDNRYSSGYSYSDAEDAIEGLGLTETQLYIIIGVGCGVIGLLILICIVCVCCCGKTCKEMCECYCFCIKCGKKIYELCTGEECGEGGEGGGGGEGGEEGGCFSCLEGVFSGDE